VSHSYLHTVSAMGTVVTIQVVGHGANRQEQAEREAGVARAAAWFQTLNDACTRFDPASELRRLSTRIGAPTPVSAILFQAVQFALAVAEQSGGAFDPTIGLQLEAHGFDTEFRSGKSMRTRLDHEDAASYRDVQLDPVARTITLRRPLLLDLGAVAKGLAIDMAARELQEFKNFAIDGGGDLYLGGSNAEGNPWNVGIRHPRDEHQLVDTLRVSDTAVCTSGDYERRSMHDGPGHHIIDPRTGRSTNALASVTVVAASAMLADALGTAAFVLGPTGGQELLRRHGAEGLLVTPTLESFMTPGLARYRAAAYA
jgi:thiamine biosynthesis lipoprotein